MNLYVMESPDPIAEVSRRGFLGALREPLRASLLEGAHLVEYPPGSVTFRNQDRSLAIVSSGLVRIYLSAPDGRQITLRYAGVGDLVGATARPSVNVDSGAQAVEQSSLLHLDPVRLDRLSKSEAELSLALVQEMEERLRRAHRWLAICAFARVRTRVARDLLERALATERMTQGTMLRATHQDLADGIGSVRDVVARAIRELRRDGVIESHRDGVTIIDPDRLLLEAEIGP
ncbi:MAG TPA: Crp/Fnr family transcriptional regulator [Candidatus Dormibacteraeota bacterium]